VRKSKVKIKKNLMILILTSLLLWILLSFSKPKIVNITDVEIKKLVANKSKFVIVDLRKNDEYEKMRIPNSISLPLNKLEDSLDCKIGDKETLIILYSKTQEECKKAANILLSKGYTKIYVLGSINNWKYDFEK